MPLPLHPEGRTGGGQVEPHPLRLVLQRGAQGPMLAGSEPLGEGRIDRRRAVRHPHLDVRRLLPQGVPELAILLLRHDQDGRRIGDVAVHHVLRGVAEERRHRVELALPDRVELVIVAGGAAHGEPEKDVADRLRPVLRVDDLVFLGHDPALVGRDVVALETRRHELVQARLGQQVARHLLHRELVERLVLVEGPDHPVAVGIHLAVVVDVDPVRIAVARCVEPVPGAVLAPLLGLEQPVDELLVGVFRRIVQEGIHDAGIGRQPRQVERGTARQRPPVRLGCRGQALGIEARENETIERVAGPLGVNHGRHPRTDDPIERPVLIPRGALVDPAPQDVDLLVAQRLVRVRRRHPQARAGVRDALVHQAGRGIALDDRMPVGSLRESAVLGIQTEPHLSRALVRPVALEAVVGQDGPHLPLKIHGRRRCALRGGGRRSDSKPGRKHEARQRPGPQAGGSGIDESD